jgi:hypothetical protein
MFPPFAERFSNATKGAAPIATIQGSGAVKRTDSSSTTVP